MSNENKLRNTLFDHFLKSIYISYIIHLFLPIIFFPLPFYFVTKVFDFRIAVLRHFEFRRGKLSLRIDREEGKK